MSATEVLRRLLDERGVKYEGGERSVRWRDRNGVMMQAFPLADGELGMDVWSCTPEQAIAATLGPAARHPKPHEQWTTVLLPEIAWGLDDRWPDYLSVAHDAHGEWRVYVPEDTLGSRNCSNSERTGTCIADETDTWECVCDQIGRYGKCVTIHVMECSECGHTYEHVNGDYEFCPHCGRRLEVTDG